MYYDYLESPIGTLLLAGNGDGLKQIEFPKKGRRVKPPSTWTRDPRPLRT